MGRQDREDLFMAIAIFMFLLFVLMPELALFIIIIAIIVFFVIPFIRYLLRKKYSEIELDINKFDNKQKERMKEYKVNKKMENLTKDAEQKFISEEGLFEDEFEKNQCYSFIKNIFTKYKQAMEEKNIEIIKTFSTEKFINNKMEEIKKSLLEENNYSRVYFDKVTSVRLYSHSSDKEKEILTFAIRHIEELNEYNPKTGKQIRGLSGRKVEKIVLADFERNIKVVNADLGKIYLRCTNCGAPTHIVTVGKCEYCGAIIKSDMKEWKLDKITEKVNIEF